MMVRKSYRRATTNACMTDVLFFDEITYGNQTLRIEYVTVYFKVSNTECFVYYNVDIHWTITHFLDKIKIWALTDFGFSLSSDQAVKVIEAGQPEAENAPCLEPNDEITYKSYYLENNKWPSFYLQLA